MAIKEKLARHTKESMAGEIKTRMKARPNFVLTNYMGSSVSDMELLRRNLKKSDSSYFVVKNSVLKVVLNELKLEEASKLIDSGMGVSLCGNDMALTCKELVNFAKGHEKFRIKAAYIDGKMITGEKVRAIAGLPARGVLLAQVVGGIKSPITGFVLVLGAVIRKFVYCIDAIKAEKEKTAPPPEAKPAPEAKAAPAPEAKPAPEAPAAPETKASPEEPKPKT